MAVYLALLGSGLGDVIVSLPWIYKSIENDQTFLVARSPRQEGLMTAIEGLSGIVREPDLDAIALRPGLDRYVDLRVHPLQTDYIWGGETFAREFPNFRINNILQIIGDDFGFHADLSQHKSLQFNVVPGFADKTIILPGTTTKSKTWSASNWLMLRSLLEARGHNVWMVGEPLRSDVVKELVASGVSWKPTTEVQNAIDIISSSRAVISVDTGLMHIAVQQKIPTVVMFQGDPIYYRPFPHCYPLFAKACPTVCQEKFEEGSSINKVDFKDYQWCHVRFENCAADPGSSCMDSFTAEMVFEKVMEAVPCTP